MDVQWSIRSCAGEQHDAVEMTIEEAVRRSIDSRGRVLVAVTDEPAEKDQRPSREAVRRQG